VDGGVEFCLMACFGGDGEAAAGDEPAQLGGEGGELGPAGVGLIQPGRALFKIDDERWIGVQRLLLDKEFDEEAGAVEGAASLRHLVFPGGEGADEGGAQVGVSVDVAVLQNGLQDVVVEL
jgi:hypothetical protein